MAEHDSKERIVPFTHETAKRRYLDYRNDIRVAAFAYGLKLDVDGSKGLAEVYASVTEPTMDQLEHVVSDWDTIGAAHRNTARDEGDMLRRIDE